MKIYLWTNSDTDFAEEPNAFDKEGEEMCFGYHSGCIVVLADNEEEARNIFKKHQQHTSTAIDDVKPIVIDLKKKGLVTYCDGEC